MLNQALIEQVMNQAANVWINVDDFGLHPAVNRAVTTLSACGAINSTSVLANGLYLDEALDEEPAIMMGAHLNILRGKPLTPAHKIPTLLDSKGLFVGRYASLYKRYVLRQLDLDQVELEWRNQIEHLLARGVMLWHLDSEKHTHCWPRLFQLAAKLAKSYGIPRVRTTTEAPMTGSPSTARLRIGLLNYWHSKNKAYARTHPCWGIFHQGKDLIPEALVPYLAKHRPDTLEIVCHPGTRMANDPILDPSLGPMRIAEQWEVEYNCLVSKALIDILQQYEYKLYEPIIT